jgi:MYXO-CTERM domain-containing protein
MRTVLTAFLVASAAIGSSAGASLTLVDGGPASPPAGTSTAFKAFGTFNNPSGGAARLEAAGQTTVQGSVGGGTGWWSGSVTRAWELSWDNSSGMATFALYSTSDWTGAAAMTMSQAPAFGAGNTLVGIDFGVRLASTTFSTSATYAFSDIQFNDGSGFVGVSTADSSYTVSGSFLTSNYHALVGPLGNFTLRGKSTFSGSVSTSADFSNFYVEGRQGIPAPGALALLGLAGLAGTRRRR